MTMVEKIFARSADVDSVSAGQTIVCDVDMAVMLDLSFGLGWQDPTRIADATRMAVILDHAVPAPSITDADAGRRARAFVKRFGIERFFDVGRHGICHQVIAENGLARPGEILACTDSHTCAAGAYNCAARGLGMAEMYSIMCTGRTWFTVAPTIRYDFYGAMAPMVSGKDVFLHIAGRFGDATNRNLEFGGPGMHTIPMNDRRTIATQAAEISADFATFGVDEVCRRFLDEHTDRPYTPADPDPDAHYDDVRRIDLDRIEPHIALPGGVSRNAIPVTDLADSVAVDQCFIGSCANGQLEDLRIAAEIVRGKKVADGIRLIVTPASQKVYLQALQLGYLETLSSAGAVVTNSTCGACFGYHMGVVGAGEVALTASTRNFTGRMGSPDAPVYMASPATVAASALTGRITDPRMVTVG
ncbi:aconitase/3-isopropylmalate dehydratase large subunit family protein [Rhodococcus sp. HM1]|uniref:3-isopropylmalate dehydratase large subunit n=1 Tax=Rhodococcus sp. HM1 TaxID=2937759 RepID=UPI00200B4232|nr:aconitase/3-isopropylmalate dehydratase large subunit family protein [Rhodococcus sp. HM1]MCK8671555.1 aconitase/3-isopropylmalate dehydratase large subunit family protein [Rhodococcus sp. HM1]